MSRMAAHIKHVILDRDGVLNVEQPDGGYVCEWSQWHWIPGAIEGLAMLSLEGVGISVATNQSCVGRGLISRADLDAIHARMLEDASQQGGVINDVFVCTHAPDSGCACRKPAPGLLLEAIEASHVLPNEIVAVGDDLRDVQAAQAANIRATLVRTGKGRLTEASLNGGVAIFDDLRELAKAVISNSISFERTAP